MAGLVGTIRKLKAERDGEIEVAGPELAHSLSEPGLIDENDRSVSAGTFRCRRSAAMRAGCRVTE
ncbi:MAG TPA: hypothetical protein PKA20_23075 [Burkholderiaceae bacterium]|nr:hypothetical protein [Burkholderiaceae bacterium]